MDAIAALTLAELEGIRLALRGGSVIDWYRLAFADAEEAQRFLTVQGLNLDAPEDLARCDQIRSQAIAYLKDTFAFPVPKPVAKASMVDLLLLASSQGHRQLCACAILKVMHIIHHLQARELLFRLPTSDEEVFQLVESKVYQVVGRMLQQGLPVVEFLGGRKNPASLYSKLLSKQETLAAQVYDKVRFRFVTRDREDIVLVLRHLLRELFPFNYVIPGESTNSLLPFLELCRSHPELNRMLPRLQLRPDLEADLTPVDNLFSSNQYRVVHFVVDMPLRLPDPMLPLVGDHAHSLGRIIFVQAEFQLIDRNSERNNAVGDASHAAYKARQRDAIARRLKLGASEARNMWTQGMEDA